MNFSFGLAKEKTKPWHGQTEREKTNSDAEVNGSDLGSVRFLDGSEFRRFLGTWLHGVIMMMVDYHGLRKGRGRRRGAANEQKGGGG